MQEETFRGCSGGCANCPRMQQCMAAGTSLDAFLRANPDRGVLRGSRPSEGISPFR